MVVSITECSKPQKCECGLMADRVYLTPPKGFVQRECVYDSPIDGRPITSWQQRRNDLARSGCQEYDPGMKQDTDRRIKAEDAALDRNVDNFVDEQIAKMPVRKLEILESELKSGASADIVRN